MQNVLNHVSAEAPPYPLACADLSMDPRRPSLIKGIPQKYPGLSDEDVAALSEVYNLTLLEIKQSSSKEFFEFTKPVDAQRELVVNLTPPLSLRLKKRSRYRLTQIAFGTCGG